ncbi:unnamed protein product [Dracunculus medinensis]|uniref:P-type phospholipid transporter n=1 Tax=Dracunculus medinensis TaxID=318479 RepID=A0A0N4UHI5_DRAME|nr:unnamed protein product [Dracunculus medinensis]
MPENERAFNKVDYIDYVDYVKVNYGILFDYLRGNVNSALKCYDMLEEAVSGKENDYRYADIAYIEPIDNDYVSDNYLTTERQNQDGNLANHHIFKDEIDGSGGFALVINGNSLSFALEENLEKAFLDIGCLCQAVLCCRVTPLQKARVVSLVKRNKKAVTLSIGDGANDVSMIKTAHIGVGISGQEGMQAVLSSDYSIGQFRYLERLLLVHGRWSYFRMTKFLRYFFYKNFAFTLIHFWYSFFCGYSAQSIFEAVFIASYNMLFTAFPVLAMGIFDQDLNDEYSLKYEKLYIPGQYNLFFNMRIFIYSVLHGMISSLVIFFIPYGSITNGSASDGRDMNDYPLLAFICSTALIMVVTGQIIIDTSYWTVFNHIVIWGSLILYFGLSYIFYEALPMSVVAKSQSALSYGVIIRAFSSPMFWLNLLMIGCVLLLPVILNRFFWFDTHPSYADRLLAYKKFSKTPVEKAKMPLKPLSRIAPTRRSRHGGSLRSGYAFSHQQGFGDLIIKGKLFKQVENLTNRQIVSNETASTPVSENSQITRNSPLLSQRSLSLKSDKTFNGDEMSKQPIWKICRNIPQKKLCTINEESPGHYIITVDDGSEMVQTLEENMEEKRIKPKNRSNLLAVSANRVAPIADGINFTSFENDSSYSGQSDQDTESKNSSNKKKKVYFIPLIKIFSFRLVLA